MLILGKVLYVQLFIENKLFCWFKIMVLSNKQIMTHLLYKTACKWDLRQKTSEVINFENSPRPHFSSEFKTVWDLSSVKISLQGKNIKKLFFLWCLADYANELVGPKFFFFFVNCLFILTSKLFSSK